MAESGVGIGELIFIPRIPFRLGDLIDEISDKDLEWDVSGAFRLIGLGFSRRLFDEEDVLPRCGEIDGGAYGLGISVTFRPFALASSCSITCAYKSASPSSRCCLSASSVLASTADSGGEIGEAF